MRGQDAGLMAFMMCYWITVLVVSVIVIIGMWKVFEKADKPGWAAIIPIYNAVVLLQIVQKPEWWVILLFIPCVNIVIMILVYVELATAFGQGGGFAAGLILLPFIFFPILGFGNAQYVYGKKRGRKRRRPSRDYDDDYYDDDYR